MHSRRMLTRGLVWFDHGSRRGRARRGEAGGPARSAVWRTLPGAARAGPTPGRGVLPTARRANRLLAPARARPPLRVCAPRRPPLRARASTQTVVRVFSTVFAAITWEFSSVRIFCSVPNQNCWVPLARNALWVRYRRSTVYASLCMFGARQWNYFGSLFILKDFKDAKFYSRFFSAISWTFYRILSNNNKCVVGGFTRMRDHLDVGRP